MLHNYYRCCTLCSVHSLQSACESRLVSRDARRRRRRTGQTDSFQLSWRVDSVKNGPSDPAEFLFNAGGPGSRHLLWHLLHGLSCPRYRRGGIVDNAARKQGVRSLLRDCSSPVENGDSTAEVNRSGRRSQGLNLIQVMRRLLPHHTAHAAHVSSQHLKCLLCLPPISREVVHIERRRLGSLSTTGYRKWIEAGRRFRSTYAIQGSNFIFSSGGHHVSESSMNWVGQTMQVSSDPGTGGKYIVLVWVYTRIYRHILQGHPSGSSRDHLLGWALCWT